jgi:hypothetical protein
MAELLKVVIVMVSAVLVLLGAGTLIQLVEQMVDRPRAGQPRP